MSAEHTTETASDPVPSEPVFDESELARFDADDTQAGRTICWMLSLFFLYTVIVMSGVGIWTFIFGGN